jgi:hypothetical protein
MAITRDKTGCGPTNGVISINSLNRVYVLSNTVDLTGETSLVTTDIYQSLAIPADTQVLMVKVEILKPAVGSALTCTVGDGSGANSWDGAVDLVAAAGVFTHSTAGTDAYQVTGATAVGGCGMFYDAADSIDIVLATVTAITAGPKFRVSAVCADFNS